VKKKSPPFQRFNHLKLIKEKFPHLFTFEGLEKEFCWIFPEIGGVTMKGKDTFLIDP